MKGQCMVVAILNDGNDFVENSIYHRGSSSLAMKSPSFCLWHKVLPTFPAYFQHRTSCLRQRKTVYAVASLPHHPSPSFYRRLKCQDSLKICICWHLNAFFQQSRAKILCQSLIPLLGRLLLLRIDANSKAFYI